jgi:hypothetical protein
MRGRRDRPAEVAVDELHHVPRAILGRLWKWLPPLLPC